MFILSYITKNLDARKLCPTQWHWDSRLFPSFWCLCLPFGWKGTAAAPGIISGNEPMSQNGIWPFLPSSLIVRVKKTFLNTPDDFPSHLIGQNWVTCSTFITGRGNDTTVIDLSQLGFPQSCAGRMVTEVHSGLGYYERGENSHQLGNQRFRTVDDICKLGDFT